MISLRVAIALLLLGALLAMLGSAWADMSVDQRLSAAGIIFVGVLLLLGLDPIIRRGRDD